MSGSRRGALLLAAVAWGAAAICYLVVEALAAAAYSPSYSYADNYISDLGAPVCGIVFAGRPVCSPLHALMNANFVLQGVLFLIAGLAAGWAAAGLARWPLAGCAALNAFGIVLVGFVPETSAVAGVHGLGALLAIVFGNMTALVSAFAFRAFGLPRAHRITSLALPSLAAIAFAALLVARARHGALLLPDGVWERASVYTITAWELVTAGCLARAVLTHLG